MNRVQPLILLAEKPLKMEDKKKKNQESIEEKEKEKENKTSILTLPKDYSNHNNPELVMVDVLSNSISVVPYHQVTSPTGQSQTNVPLVIIDEPKSTDGY